jgi:hypothetical protein
MLAYLTILAASMCGYAGAPVWSLLLAAAGLFSVSYSQHQGLIRRGLDRGFQDDVSDTLWRSGVNALTTTGGAFVFGMVLKALG